MEWTNSDFPAVETVNPADLAATHQELAISPVGRPELAFSLALPNGWAADSAAVGPAGEGDNWKPLAVLASKDIAVPAGGAAPTAWSIVTVLWRRLEAEVPIAEWAIRQLGALKVEATTVRLWNDAAGPVIDIGGTCVGAMTAPGGWSATSVPTVVRMMVRLDGQHAFAVLGMATPDAYTAGSRNLLVAGASFRLARPPQGGREEFKKAAAANPAFEVVYPGSWVHQLVNVPPEIIGKSGLDLLLVQNNQLQGFVRVKAIDRGKVKIGSVEQLASDAADEVAQAGVVLQQPWSPLADPVIGAIPGVTTLVVSSALLQNNPYEAHFAIVEHPTLIFCVTALALPMELEPFTSMRGRRAYAIALESLKATK